MNAIDNPRRAAIYARVSTPGQTPDNQLIRLRELADRAGFAIVEEYVDTASGTSTARAGMRQMMIDANRRQFDVLLAWDVSRLGRSMQHLVTLFETLRTLGIDLVLDRQGFDTTTPAGRMQMQMCAVFAEFERAIIAERTRAGLARAAAQGKRLGRPPASPAIIAAIRNLRAGGMGMDRIARQLRCGKSLSQRVCREYDKENSADDDRQPSGTARAATAR